MFRRFIKLFFDLTTYTS